MQGGVPCLIEALGSRFWQPAELPRRKEYAILLALATDPQPGIPGVLARCGGVRQLLKARAVWEGYPGVPLALLQLMAQESSEARQQLLQVRAVFTSFQPPGRLRARG